MRVKKALVFAVPLLLTACFGPPSSVARVVSGHRLDGRYVNDTAYAAYLRGAVLEAKGDLGGAIDAYREALREDPDSAELWTRVGAVRCALGGAQGSPWDAFTRASELDVEYEGTWSERGKCHLARGDVARALESARIAVSLDPSRVENVALLVRALERSDRLDEARRWMDGLVTREPRSLEAERAMLEFARRTGDAPRREAAARALVAMAPHLRDELAKELPTLAPLAAIDAALARDDRAAARTLAVEAHVPSGALALRAAAIGNLPFAKSQAELVLAADPHDADARVALATVADLAHDDAALASALAETPANPAPLSPLAGFLMAELLDRRIGHDAAVRWRAALGAVPTGGDSLLDAVGERQSR